MDSPSVEHLKWTPVAPNPAHVPQILVPTDGTWTFFLSSDDGSRLFIDGALVVDNPGEAPVHGNPTWESS